MNVFQRYTVASLRKNRGRTLVTLIGIILSMALFTAVTEGAYSGIQFLIRSETANSGAWHGYYHDLTAAQVSEVRADKEIKDLSVWQDVGWAEIGSENEYKPYLYVQSIDDRAADLVAIHLLEGRLPENETELLLPEHLTSNGGVSFAVGDTLTLDLGYYTDGTGRTLGPVEGWPSWQNAVCDTKTARTFKVVGIYGRFDVEVEDYGCPGYYALTKGGGTGDYAAFFTVRHVNRFYDYMEQHAVTDTWRNHNSLLGFYGSLRNEGLTSILYGFAAVLIFLIAFGSISLIYNAFSISVSERTRQFGVLKSVGATKKQIRGAVLFEALVLSAIAIPIGLVVGCLGIGVTLRCLRDGFALIVPSAARGSVQMQVVLNLPALAIAVLVCLVTTLISAWIPAIRALRISPIQAIRQNEDVKLRTRDVRTWGLTGKLFGFEGLMAAKNFRRNRKRYRAVILSLFLSVVLFISASSFCAYLTDTVKTVVPEGAVAYDLLYRDGQSETDAERDSLFLLLSGVEGVEEGTWYRSTNIDLRVPAAALSKENPFRAEDPDGMTNAGTPYAAVVFLRDADFRALCRKNGLDADRYFDPAQPCAAICNDVTEKWYTEEGARWQNYAALDPAALPVQAEYLPQPELDGFVCYGETEDGTLCYYPDDYWSTYWQAYDLAEQNGEPLPELDESKATLVKPETLTFTMEGVIAKPAFSLENQEQLTLVYPASQYEAVFGGTDAVPSLYTTYLFRAPAHAAAVEEMGTLLGETAYPAEYLMDMAAANEAKHMLVTIVNVFSYGFIILISLIAIANVVNTISTSVALRRREFAMLRSIGLGNRGFRRMMNYECLIYGLRSLLWGLPAAALLTLAIWKITGFAVDRRFYIPWYSVAIAVGSVFLVVFLTMLYATGRIRKDNPIDALKTETL